MSKDATSKYCPHCTGTLALTAFGVNTQSIDGRHYYCRECAAEKQRLRYYADPAPIRAQKKKYRDKIVARNRMQMA